MDRMANRALSLAAAALAVALAAPAQAAYVTATVKGEILGGSGPFAAGDPIVESVTFDPARLVDVTGALNHVLTTELGESGFASALSASLYDDPDASLDISVDGISFSKSDAIGAGTPEGAAPIDLGVGDFPTALYIDGAFAGVTGVFQKDGFVFNGDPISAAHGAFPEYTNFVIAGHGAGAAGWLDVSGATFGPAALPEPSTWALMISGVALVGAALRRRPERKAKAAWGT